MGLSSRVIRKSRPLAVRTIRVEKSDSGSIVLVELEVL